MNRRITLAIAVVAALATLAATAEAQTDKTFTYQGRLDFQGEPYTGTADYRFTLWDALTAGARVGPEVALDEADVDAGLFTAELDFGSDALADQRWLQIAVRTPAWNGMGVEPPFSTLEPRHAVTGSPYSIRTRGIFVNEAGNRVGIGTEAPNHPLHVVGSPATTALIESPNTVGTWLNLLNTSAGGRYWRLISTGEGNGEGAGNLLIGHGASAGTQSSVMTLRNDGRVGIGTSNPGARLEVVGDVRIGGSNTTIDLGDSPDDTVNLPGRITFGDGSVQSTAYRAVGGTSSVNFGPIGGGGRAGAVGGLAGAQPGDLVVISVRGDTPHPFVIHGAYVPAPNQYRFLFTNLSGSTIDAPPFTFDVIAIRP